MAKKTPEDIMREAEALIQQTRQSLSASAETGSAAGRPEGLSPTQEADARTQAEALFRKDLEDIEREVAEEAARLSFSQAAPRAGGARKMRNMI